MIPNFSDIVVLSTYQGRDVADDGTVSPPRTIAIGTLRFRPLDLECGHFDLAACAVDLTMSTDAAADHLARWLLEQSGKSARLIGWCLDDPIIAGLIDISQKADPCLAGEMLECLQQWAAEGVTDIAPLMSSPADIWDAAEARGITVPLNRIPSIEEAGAQMRMHIADTVVAQAVVQWRIWAQRAGLHAGLHELALQSLSDWRVGTTAA